MPEALFVPGLSPAACTDLLRAKTYAQYLQMHRSLTAGECLFCPPDTDLNQIIFRNKHWYCWLNPFPARGTRKHILLVTTRHIQHFLDLTREELADLQPVFTFLGKSFDLPGGGMLTRFGDPRLNAGTLRHLHTNIMVPNEREELRPPLFKYDPVKAQHKLAVARAFEALRQNGVSLEEAMQGRPVWIKEKDWDLVSHLIT